jgi:hypothetical protein
MVCSSQRAEWPLDVQQWLSFATHDSRSTSRHLVNLSALPGSGRDLALVVCAAIIGDVEIRGAESMERPLACYV